MSILAHKRYRGRGDGLPLVMLHGFLCGGEFFAPNINEPAAVGDVITVDLPGFGESCDLPPASSIAEMGAQVLSTLAAIGLDKFNLLGHSMGGMVALQMAVDAAQKINKLILFASNDSGDLPERFETFAASKARVKKDFDRAREEIVATWFRHGAAHPHYAMCLRCSARVTPAAACDALDAMAEFDARARLKNIAQPTLIIAAEHDRTYALHRLRQLQQNIKGARLHVMRGCAHNAHLESPDEFNRTVAEFCAG